MSGEITVTLPLPEELAEVARRDPELVARLIQEELDAAMRKHLDDWARGYFEGKP